MTGYFVSGATLSRWFLQMARHLPYTSRAVVAPDIAQSSITGLGSTNMAIILKSGTLSDGFERGCLLFVVLRLL